MPRRLSYTVEALDDLHAVAGWLTQLGAGGYRAMYEVVPDTGRSATAGDVMVLRVYGPGQSRDGRAEGS